MTRRANKNAVEARLIRDRYGATQRTKLYARIAGGRPFGLFLIEGKLSFSDYPSARCSGLLVDLPHALVAIYEEMPTMTQVVEDLDETERALADLPAVV